MVAPGYRNAGTRRGKKFGKDTTSKPYGEDSGHERYGVDNLAGQDTSKPGERKFGADTAKPGQGKFGLDIPDRR
jgi:hypothetical protein